MLHITTGTQTATCPASPEDVWIGLPQRLPEYLQLIDDEETADCRITVSDATTGAVRTFAAHYGILKVRCPQLVVSFKYDCEEASHRHVKMDGTCPQLFALFLELIYTGACCMDWVQLVPMYQLCDLLLLPQYAEFCLEALRQRKRNAAATLEILQILDTFLEQGEFCSEAALQIINLLQLQGITVEVLSAFGVKLLTLLLNHHLLPLSEVQRVLAATAWAKRQPPDAVTPEALAPICQTLHWGLLDARALLQNARASGLLTDKQLVDLCSVAIIGDSLPQWLAPRHFLPRADPATLCTWEVFTDQSLEQYHAQQGPVYDLWALDAAGGFQFQAPPNLTAARLRHVASLLLGFPRDEVHLWGAHRRNNGTVRVDDRQEADDPFRTMNRWVFVERRPRGPVPLHGLLLFVKQYVKGPAPGGGTADADAEDSARAQPKATGQLKYLGHYYQKLGRPMSDLTAHFGFDQSVHFLHEEIRPALINRLLWSQTAESAELQHGDILIIAEAERLQELPSMVRRPLQNSQQKVVNQILLSDAL